MIKNLTYQLFACPNHDAVFRLFFEVSPNFPHFLELGAAQSDTCHCPLEVLFAVELLPLVELGI